MANSSAGSRGAREGLPWAAHIDPILGYPSLLAASSRQTSVKISMRLNASDITIFKASAALAPRGPNSVDYSALPNHRGAARHAGKPPRHASFTYIDPSACLLWISSLCGILLSTQSCRQ